MTPRIPPFLASFALFCAACGSPDPPPDATSDTVATDASDISQSQPDIPAVDAVAPPVGVYAEFLTDDRIATQLSSLASARADLQLAIPAARIGDPMLAQLLRNAATAGVSVRAWLLLDRADGYWPNESNLTIFAAQARRLLDWLATDGLRITTLIFDMEPALGFSEQLRAAYATGLDTAVSLLRSHRDPIGFTRSRETLSALVREIQSRGIRVEAVTYPQVLDDLADGDDDMQDALDIPIRGVPWDEVAFMVYQSAFAEAVRQWLGPGLIRSYALAAREGFGDRATIALGTVGSEGIFDAGATPTYMDPRVLGDDVAAALGAGIRRVEIYSLDGMLSQGGVDRWLAATVVAPRVVSIAGTVNVARSLTFGIDADLNDRADAGVDGGR